MRLRARGTAVKTCKRKRTVAAHKKPRESGALPFGQSIQRPFAPLLTAPGSACEPMLLTPAAVGAPELLASLPDGREPGLTRPLFMLAPPFMPVVAAGGAVAAPGPTLPELDAPGAG